MWEIELLQHIYIDIMVMFMETYKMKTPAKQTKPNAGAPTKSQKRREKKQQTIAIKMLK